MAITYYMLQISPVVLFILVMTTGALLSGLITYLFRTYIRLKVLRSHNEVTGFLFTSIASFYALLLGFVVFLVWGRLNETQGQVNREGSMATALYRDIKFYPNPQVSKQLKSIYLEYVHLVIEEEFPKMEYMKLSRKTPEALNRLYFMMNRIQVNNEIEALFLSEMFSNLNELSASRDLRVATMESEIPAPMWLPIILGAIITITCAMLLDIESARMHISLTSLFGSFIGMILFIIIFLDHPFSGTERIKPKAYIQIEVMENWTTEITGTTPKPN